MHHKVVAVEARLAHIQMLHHAVVLNRFQPRISLVHNAISDTHATMSLQLNKDNQGATRVIKASNMLSSPSASVKNSSKRKNSAYHVDSITMDDLRDLDAIKSWERAIIKLDIEGDESKAILSGVKFLQSLIVPFIIMEWEFMRKTPDEEGEEVLDILQTLGYQAHTIDKEPLDDSKWRRWPNDIIWKHRSADL